MIGLGNAIIVIRGVDLLSKNVTSMANRYTAELTKMQRANAALKASSQRISTQIQGINTKIADVQTKTSEQIARAYVKAGKSLETYQIKVGNLRVVDEQLTTRVGSYGNKIVASRAKALAEITKLETAAAARTLKIADATALGLTKRQVSALKGAQTKAFNKIAELKLKLPDISGQLAILESVKQKAQQVADLEGRILTATTPADKMAYLAQQKAITTEMKNQMRGVEGLTAAEQQSYIELTRKLALKKNELAITQQQGTQVTENANKEVAGIQRASQTRLAALNIQKAGLQAVLKINNSILAATNNIQLAMTKVIARASEWRARLQGTFSTLSSAGLMLSALVSAPLLMLGQDITRVFMEYDKALREIQGIGRQTDSQLEALSTTFHAMSMDIKQTIATPYELAKAFYEIQSASYYGADAMNILRVSTKTATAALADQVDTAKMLTGAIHAYNVPTTEVGKFADVITRASDIGVFRLEEWNQHAGEFLNTVALIGISIEEAAAAMSTMTKRGIQVPEAATSLNRIATAFLQKKTEDQLAIADLIDFDFSPKHFKDIGFTKILEEIWKKTGGDQEIIARLFPEMREMRGLFGLLSDGVKMFREDLALTMTSGGSVMRLFNINTKSFAAQWQNLINSITVLKIALGKELLPIIMQFAKTTILPLVREFTQLSTIAKQGLVKLGVLFAALGPGLLILGAGINSLLSIEGALLRILTAPLSLVARLGTGFIGLGRNILTASSALSAAGGAFTGILGFIGPVVGAIATLAIAAGAATFGFIAWRENTLGLAVALDTLAKREGVLGGLARQLQNIFLALDNTGFLENWSVIWEGMEGGINLTRILGEGFRFVALFVIEFKRQIQLAFLQANSFIGVAKALGITLAESFQLAVQSLKDLLSGIISLSSALGKIARGNYLGAVSDALTGLEKFKDIGRDIETFKLADPWREAIKDVEKYEQAIIQVNNQYEIEKRAIKGLNLQKAAEYTLNPASGRQLIDPRNLDNDLLLDNFRGSIDAISDAMAEYQQQINDAIPSITPGDKVDLGSLEDGADAAKKAGEDLAQEIIDGIQSKLDEGSSFSINLGDMRGGTYGGGPLAPGANGAFEALYRIQDVAANLGKPTEGADTKKWYEMYFGGMGFEEAIAKATDIIKKFQMGVFTPDVTQYIDEGALVNTIQMEKLAEESKKAYAEALAKAHPELDRKIINSYLGLGTSAKGATVVPDMTPTVQAVQTSVNQAVVDLPSNPDNILKLLGISKDDTGKLVIPNTSGIARAIHDQISTAMSALPALELPDLDAEITLTYAALPPAPELPALTRLIELSQPDVTNLPTPELTPLQRAVEWVYETFVAPNIAPVIVLIKWLIEKVVLPTLPALMQTVKFIYERFIAPQLPVLTLLVGWLIEKFVVPTLPVLKIVVEYLMARFIAPALPTIYAIVDWVTREFVAPRLPAQTVIVGWLIETFVAPVLPKLLQAVGFTWDDLQQPVLPKLYQIIAFQFTKLVLPVLQPLIQMIGLKYNPLPNITLPTLMQTVMLNFVLAFPEEAATVGGFFTTLKNKIQEKLESLFGGGDATSMAPALAPTALGSLLSGALSLGAETLDVSFVDIALTNVQTALNTSARALANLDYVRNILMLDRPAELATVAASVIPILANGIQAALIEDELLYNAGTNAGTRFGNGFRQGVKESVGFRGVIEDVVYAVLSEED